MDSLTARLHGFGRSVADTVTGINPPSFPPANDPNITNLGATASPAAPAPHPGRHRIAPPTLLSFAFSRYALALGLWTMVRSRVRDMIAPRTPRDLTPVVTLAIRLPVILFLISRFVWLWNAISDSNLGSQWRMAPWTTLASYFPAPEPMDHEDLLFHTFLVNLAAVTVDMWVHANTRIGPFDMESIPSFAEWGLSSYLHPEGPDILMCNLILTFESLLLQLLAIFPSRPDKKYRLIPTSISGILGLVHFLYRFRYPTYPAMVALAKWPEAFSIAVVAFVMFAYSLARVSNPGGMRERPASLTWSMMPKLSDTYSPSLFKVAGAVLSNPQSAPLRYEADPVFLTFVTPPVVPDDFGQITTVAPSPRPHLGANPFNTQHAGQSVDSKHPMLTRSRAARVLGASNHYMRALGFGKIHEILVYLGANSILGALRFVARKIPQSLWPREFLRARLGSLMPLYLSSESGGSHHVSSAMSSGPGGMIEYLDGQARVGQPVQPDTIHGVELDDCEDDLSDPLFQSAPEEEDEEDDDDDDAYGISDGEEGGDEVDNHPSDHQPTPEATDLHRQETLRLNDTHDLLMTGSIPVTELADLRMQQYHALVQTLPSGYLAWRSNQVGLRAGPIVSSQRDLYLPMRMDEPLVASLQAPPPPPAQCTANCVVCTAEPRTILLHPCGCLILCDECRQAMALQGVVQCPTCRRSITSFSRVFQP